MDLSSSFKAYDVRGLVGVSLTDDVAEAIGAAFVDVLGLAGKTVFCGGDMRPSSKGFVSAFSQGAAARGANVHDLGLIATDELYFACGALNAAGAIFTASHNPAQYNGIKMAKAGAVPISSDSGLFDIRDLAQRYLDHGFPKAESAGTVAPLDVLGDYALKLRSLVDLSGARPLKVVVDAGNGMAGLTVPAVLGSQILEALPLTIVPLYFELDGTFPNHPANPLEPENLRDLQAAVVAHGADLGLAFDGDADRCFVVDETGQPVTPSAITSMIAVREISRVQAAGQSNPVVIHNLITSRSVPEFVKLQAAGQSVHVLATRSSRPEWLKRTPSLVGNIQPTITSVTSTTRTPACWQPCTYLLLWASNPRPYPRLHGNTSRTRPAAKSTPPCWMFPKPLRTCAKSTIRMVSALKTSMG